MVSLRRLRYFVTIAEHGSFTAAAELLSISQPGLSHQIKVLETELGGRLLDRSGRKVTLTVLGRAVLPHARSAVERGQRVEHAARSVLEGAGGVLHVSSVYSLSLAALPVVLGAWHAQYPQVEIHVHEYSDVQPLLDAFADGEADVALTPLPDRWTGERHLVGTEELVVAAPVHHPAALRREVEFADLAEERWVHFTPEHGLAGVLEHLGRVHGFRPRAAMRTSQTAAAARYVAAGVGLAVLPANLVEGDCAVIHLRPPVTRNVYLLTRDTDDPLVSAFADLVERRLPLYSPAEGPPS